MVVCFLLVFIAAASLFADPDPSLVGAMLIAVPIRALGGVFVARFDQRWRDRSIEKRCKARASKKAGKAHEAVDIEYQDKKVS